MKTSKTIQKISLVFLSLAMVLWLAVPCRAAEFNAVAEARNGVVRILSMDPNSGKLCTGTGFGIGYAGEETEYFVTNWHVVTLNGEYPIGAMDVFILLSNDAVTSDTEGLKLDRTKMVKCTVVYSADQYPDVAILKAERKVPGRVALPLRSARDVPVASKVYSLGYPGAADAASISESEQTSYLYADVDSVHINGGVVSKLDAFELFGGTYCLEHDAHINGGNSGGPLVDENGYVVGINTYGVSTDEFLNYSVYIDYAMDYLNQLDIHYDVLIHQDPEFPVVPVAIGLGVAAVLAVVLVVLKKKAPKEKQPPVDTGLRVQFSPDAIQANKRYVIKGTLRFGRAPDCNIRYPNGAPGISGHHCEIFVEAGQIYIRDLNSSHGTFVNGSRIVSNQQIPLTVGANVSLGGAKERFQIVRSTKAQNG